MSLPPPPPTVVHRAAAPGAALSVIGVGVAGTSLFGLPLESRGDLYFSSYQMVHQVAALSSNDRAAELFNGFQWWWSWGQLTLAALLLVLVGLAVSGIAQRALGFVVAAMTVVFGVLVVIACSRTPGYRSIQSLSRNGDRIFDNVSYGVWVGLLGLVVLLGGALTLAMRARPQRVVVAPYFPSPPVGDYEPSMDPPAKQL